MPFPARRCVLMAFSTLGDTLGRPSFLPCWRTRSRPARTLARSIDLSCSPNTDAIWIIARPIGVEESNPLLVAIQADAGSVEFCRGIGHMEDASAQPINRPDHKNVIATPH